MSPSLPHGCVFVNGKQKIIIIHIEFVCRIHRCRVTMKSCTESEVGKYIEIRVGKKQTA